MHDDGKTTRLRTLLMALFATMTFAATGAVAQIGSGTQQQQTATAPGGAPLEGTLQAKTPADLIGKQVVTAEGASVGTVQEVLHEPRSGVVRVIVSRAEQEGAAQSSGTPADIAFLPNQLVMDGDQLVLRRVISPSEMQQNAMFDRSDYQPMDRSQQIGINRGAQGGGKAAASGTEQPRG